MARISRRQFTFANGEVSRSTWGRADMDFYYASLARCENWVTDQRGVLHRRGGSTYATQYDVEPAFYGFLDGTSRRVLIIALPDRFEFMIDGALVQFAGSTFTLPHAYGADYRDLRVTPDLNVSYIWHPDHPTRSIQTSGSVFSLNSEDVYPFDRINSDESCKLQLGEGGSSGGTSGFLSPVDDPVSTDIMLVEPGGDPADRFTATVTEALGGSVVSVDLSETKSSGTYQEVIEDPPGTFILGSREFDLEVNGARLTAQGCAPFTADMVGQNIRYLDEDGKTSDDDTKNTWVTVRVLQFISTTEVDVAYSGPNLKRTDLFQLPLFLGGEYAKSGAILDDRLWTTYQNRVQGSRSQDFFDWNPTDTEGNVNPDNAIYRRISGGSSGAVRWLASMGRHVVAGTERGVFSLVGSGVSGSFQADATAQQRNERVSCADIEPVEVGDGILFIGGSRRQVFRTQFAGQYDQITTADQTLFADHIGVNRFKRLAFQENPYSICWAVTEKGELVSHTVVPGQGIQGWFRHVLGGHLQIGNARVAPRVMDLHAQSSVEGDDWLYLAVERTIGGQTVFSVEYINRFFRIGEDPLTAELLDCSSPVQTAAVGDVDAFGPTGATDLPDGRYGLSDGDWWVFGEALGGVFRADTPNTSADPVPGRDWVSENGSAFAVLQAAPEKGEAEYVHSTAEVYRGLIEITDIRAEVTAAVGLEHLANDDVTVLVDGRDVVRTVSAVGTVEIEGAVARVGFSYDSILELLPLRANLGSSDGANDPTRVIELAILVGDTIALEVGSGRRNDAQGMAFHYNGAPIPESGIYAPEPFNGWVDALPFANLSNNDEPLVSIRARGPYPARIDGIEAIIDVHGGR